MNIFDNLLRKVRYLKYSYLPRRFIAVNDVISCVSRRFVNDGATVLDVGANIGMSSLMLSRNVGRHGKVISFEPNPAHWSRLRRIERENLLGNIKCYPFGLGSANGKIPFWIDSREGSEASTFNARFMADESNIRGDIFAKSGAQIHRLDDVFTGSFSFMKIDVEGFELEVLKGGEDSIAKNRPVILFEFFFNDRDSVLLNAKNELLDFFYRLNYRVLLLKPFFLEDNIDPSLAPFTTLTPKVRFDNRIGCDLLALPYRVNNKKLAFNSPRSN